MNRTFDTSSDLSQTARTRVRLPQRFAAPRVFQGWGPDLGR